MKSIETSWALSHCWLHPWAVPPLDCFRWKP